MDGSSFVALFLAGKDDTATSALPHAPRRVKPRKPQLSKWDVRRGRLASMLHRLAWAIEPDTQSTFCARKAGEPHALLPSVVVRRYE